MQLGCGEMSNVCVRVVELSKEGEGKEEAVLVGDESLPADNPLPWPPNRLLLKGPHMLLTWKAHLVSDSSEPRTAVGQHSLPLRLPPNPFASPPIQVPFLFCLLSCKPEVYNFFWEIIWILVFLDAGICISKNSGAS